MYLIHELPPFLFSSALLTVCVFFYFFPHLFSPALAWSILATRVFLILRIRFFFRFPSPTLFLFGMLLPFVSFPFAVLLQLTVTGLCVENNVDMKRGSLHLSCIQTGGPYKPDDRKYLTALLSRLATNLLYDD